MPDRDAPAPPESATVEAARIAAAAIERYAKGEKCPRGYADLAEAATANVAAVAAENAALKALLVETAQAVIRLTELLVQIRYRAATDEQIVEFHNTTLHALDDAILALPATHPPPPPSLPFPVPDGQALERRRDETRGEADTTREEAA